MRNIAITQIVVVLFVGILLFSDFSKMMKHFYFWVKTNKIYKNVKKK